MMETECTIAAVATPAGEGGIAVIRISGKRAVDICGKIVKAKKPLSKYKERRAIYASIFEGDKFIDDVIVAIYRSPASYTGEDVVEISCHGSTYITQLILDLLIKNGADPAGPGEFTKRAFLNGKMDLAQAEAVADLIRAKTESSRRVAAMQLKGKLSKKLSEMREELIKVMSLIELELDFSEEDIEFASRENVLKLIERIKEELEYLLQNYRRGRIKINLVDQKGKNLKQWKLLDKTAKEIKKLKLRFQSFKTLEAYILVNKVKIPSKIQIAFIDALRGNIGVSKEFDWAFDKTDSNKGITYVGE